MSGFPEAPPFGTTISEVIVPDRFTVSPAPVVAALALYWATDQAVARVVPSNVPAPDCVTYQLAAWASGARAKAEARQNKRFMFIDL